MNAFITLFHRCTVKLTQRLERSRQRQQLLGKNERLLADMGFSRELLLEGVPAWPWSHPEDGEIEVRKPRLVLATRPDSKSEPQGDVEPKALNAGRRDSGGRDRQRLVATDAYESVA